MTLLAPQFLFAALAIAAAVIALHFLVTRQPRAGVLPTARFVPDRPATATARAARPSDLPLMLLRVLLVMATGLALARPVPTPARRAEARVILVDASRSVKNAAALRDGARSVVREGDVVVVFDSAARLVSGRVADSLRLLTPSARTGRLSAALVAAMRAATTISASADSLELVIVSPLAAEEMDAATASIRRMWPGRARLLRVGGGAPDSASASTPIELRSRADDPLRIAVAATRADHGSALIVRDSALAPAPAVTAGRALVYWPVDARPRGAIRRPRTDTTGAVVAGDAIVVAPFERRWRFPRDSVRGAHVVARWADGDPAVVEWANDSACTRSASIPVPTAGDLVVRADFIALVARLARACRGAVPMTPTSASAVAQLAGTGGRASHRAFPLHRDAHSTLAPWLFALAIILAIVELMVRTRRIDSASVMRARAPGVAA
ncbi:MAG: BatA domain-containing protein [Gemmatimonadaceae bacterium]